MYKILSFIRVSSKELIIIGNIRAAEMEHFLIIIDYNSSSPSYYKILLTKYPAPYKVLNVQITAESENIYA